MAILTPDWPIPDNVAALYTNRKQGKSQIPWDSYNLATHVNDDLSKVLDNRTLLKQQAQLPTDPEWLNQTHGTNVITLSETSCRNGDASITRQINQIAVVLTADCLPLLVCNQQGTEVAAIHAGWKGLLDGIVINTIQTMTAKPADLLVWLGPAISQKHFEVGAEVKQQFSQTYAQAEQHFKANTRGKFQADLYGLVKDQLSSLGVKQVYGGDYCSYTQKDQFFSYRRDGVTGRMASLIWLKSCIFE